jgi:hypothetical protein
MPEFKTYSQACTQALLQFILDASNENKMELFLAFDDDSISNPEQELGSALYQDIRQIVFDNDHADAYLQLLKEKYFK